MGTDPGSFPGERGCLPPIFNSDILLSPWPLPQFGGSHHIDLGFVLVAVLVSGRSFEIVDSIGKEILDCDGMGFLPLAALLLYFGLFRVAEFHFGIGFVVGLPFDGNGRGGCTEFDAMDIQIPLVVVFFLAGAGNFPIEGNGYRSIEAGRDIPAAVFGPGEEAFGSFR